MSWETAKKFIDLILASDERTAVYLKSRECPGVMLDFIGGEPLLEIDLISDICDYFIEQCHKRRSVFRRAGAALHPEAQRTSLDERHGGRNKGNA